MSADANNQKGRSACPVVFAVIVASLIFALLVLKMQQYIPSTAPDAARKAERAKALADLRADEASALSSPAWIDQAKGLVRLPISEAMKLAEREWETPAQARSNLVARVEKATALPPKPPEQASPFE